MHIVIATGDVSILNSFLQSLKRSLASSTNAVLELASFAIAFKIFSLFSGAADEFKYLTIVLLKSSKDRKNLLIFAGCIMIIPVVLMILLGWCFYILHIIFQLLRNLLRRWFSNEGFSKMPKWDFYYLHEINFQSGFSWNKSGKSALFISVPVLRWEILLLCYAFVLIFSIGVSPLGHYVIEDFHDVSREVGDRSRTALLIFSFYPVLDAIVSFWLHIYIFSLGRFLSSTKW